MASVWRANIIIGITFIDLLCAMRSRGYIESIEGISSSYSINFHRISFFNVNASKKSG
jgi:hypothetical protein